MKRLNCLSGIARTGIHVLGGPGADEIIAEPDGTESPFLQWPVLQMNSEIPGVSFFSDHRRETRWLLYG